MRTNKGQCVHWYLLIGDTLHRDNNQLRQRGRRPWRFDEHFDDRRTSSGWNRQNLGQLDKLVETFRGFVFNLWKIKYSKDPSIIDRTELSTSWIYLSLFGLTASIIISDRRLKRQAYLYTCTYLVPIYYCWDDRTLQATKYFQLE